ncbi:hypothetical protein ACVMFA_007021 [Bradyrhizobium liaoningense]|nr:hypothetical protein GCM10007858_47950 [Bradyrhizobium liaoningense]
MERDREAVVSKDEARAQVFQERPMRLPCHMGRGETIADLTFHSALLARPIRESAAFGPD